METQMQIRIPKQLKDDFRKIAENNAHNTSALVRKWIENYIEENKEELK
ncbi:hypothetical protein [Virgibacillus sp. CBA3643]